MTDGHPQITGRTILVTGAGGSIGSALCTRLLALRPAHLILLTLTEGGMVSLMRHIDASETGTTRLTYVLGSAADEPLLAHWMRGVDVVIHAAAHKHVPLLEAQPCAAVLNNIASTLAVCQAAQEAGVQRCLLISTDKAVSPASIMGASKLLAERIIASHGPRFLTVRFGNVLDSAGSVLPLWREQLARGGPLTVTDPACERYFMSIHEACTLILETLALDVDRGTFVFDMGQPRNLLTMAEDLIVASERPCDIVYTGLRPGEKLTEALYDGERQATAHPRVFQVPAAPPLPSRDYRLTMLLGTARQHDAEATAHLLWEIVKTPELVQVAPGPFAADRLQFVTWKWHGNDPARVFASEHVNVLYAMLTRHYHAPFTLVCITDDPSGLDRHVIPLALPDTKADRLGPPQYSPSKLFPACYRRLWLFSREAAALLGPRICQLDMDVVILDDITDTIQGKTADFVGWCDPRSFGWAKIAGGFWLLTLGTHPEVWDTFDPDTSPALAREAGFSGSDQAWLSYMLYPPKQFWVQKDGIIKLSWLTKAGVHPPGHIKMVFFVGRQPPWHPRVQLGHRWIVDHWRLGV